MSLRAFHVLFISAAGMLALVLAWWCVPEQPVGAAVSLVAALGLVGYETWFLRKTRSLS